MPLDALVTGRVATFAGASGSGWVEAIGIKDGRVAFAGSAVELETRADPHTQRFELEPGEIAIPGLVDAHLHLIDAALEAERVDLTAAQTVEAAVAAIRAYAGTLGPDDWVEGAGWDQRRFGRWPSAADLEAALPGRAVVQWSFDHHAVWVSPAALAAAGITASTPDPEGGIIQRDDGGAPTGVLLENAARLVNRAIPPATEATLERALGAMGRSLLGLGVVGVHDPGFLIPDPELRLPALLGRLADRGAVAIRVHAGIRADALPAALDRGLRSGARLGASTETGPGSDRVRVGWLKLFADGTLGSRTAALLDPIGGPPPDPAAGPRGVFTTPPEVMAQLAARAAAGGIATQIHAIGDGGVRAALDAVVPTAA
ncbi:MAG TPA: amidohydrolase family protein, partial [Candidatus Limnocylindrales bacterium]